MVYIPEMQASWLGLMSLIKHADQVWQSQEHSNCHQDLERAQEKSQFVKWLNHTGHEMWVVPVEEL